MFIGHVSSGGSINKEIKNTQIYTKISGRVWDEGISGKKSEINDNYSDDSNSGDVLLRGGNVIVRLKNRDGNTLAQLYQGNTGASDFGTKLDKTQNSQKITDGNGSYLFEGVAISDIQANNLYVEFEYDGLIYQTLPVNFSDNGSKAKEIDEERTNFNISFQDVTNSGNNNQSITRGNANNSTYPYGPKVINYDFNNYKSTMKDNYESISSKDRQEAIAYGATGSLSSYDENNRFTNTLNYDIKANTNTAGYKINDNFAWGVEEVKNINLGLYQREQPDMAVQKDVENVQLVMNGYTHTYNYAKRFANQGDIDKSYSDIGVKFGNERGTQQYTRPIYKSDIAYADKEGGTELQVYITYRIQVRNESTGVSLKTSFVDYYDSNCNVVEAGTDIKIETGNVSGRSLNVKDESYNDKFNKTTITENGENIDTLIAPQTTMDVYVKFKLNRTAIEGILNGDKIIDNVVDINSYTVYNNDGSIRAGIDKDSAPGNAIPGTVNTYEDDTDTAPSLVLQKAEDRDFQGTVFEDNAVEPTGTGNIREGNGQYDEGENAISNVDITIKERNRNENKPVNYNYGDVNEDGIINKEDADMILSASVKSVTLTKDQEILADVTGDGNVDSIDADEVLREIGKEITKFPVESSMTYITKTVDKKTTYRINEIIKDKNGNELYNGILDGFTGTIPANSSIEYQPIKDSGGNVSLDVGGYYIKGYIPGEYTTTYTWGDGHYTVQDYKGTIFNDRGAETNKNWYLNTTPRNSDAKDNYNNTDNITRTVPNGSRQQIDQEMSDIYNGDAETGYTYHKMDSTTPIMDVGLENSEKDNKNANTLTDGNSSYNYNISNIDFGIIERAKQELTVNKRISHVKLTLANQQVILDSDVIINAFGNYEIKTPNNICTYMPASASSQYGEVKIELDNELIQGSRLEITYSLTVKNLSEVDYDDINYYHYGEIPSDSDKDNKIVKITPTKVFDYLDKENSLNPDNLGKWKEYTNIGSTVDTTYQYEPTLKERQNVTITTDAGGTNVTKADGTPPIKYEAWKTELYGQRYKDLLTQRVYYNNGKALVDNKTNLTIGSATDAENSDFSGYLAPNASTEVSFDSSKELTSTDDISLDNRCEVTKIDKKSTGSTGENKGHTLVISSTPDSDLEDNAETAIVVPNTGANYDYTEIIILSFSTLAILAAGVLIIKKKAIK